ncbi:MAG: outer membrane protein transport protein, partial [Thermoanaerobaculia bacterium]
MRLDVLLVAAARVSVLLVALTCLAGAADAQVGPPREPPALSGFSIIPFDFGPPGARALGMGGAFIALADDATAAEANPAGLTNLSRAEASIHLRHSEFEVEAVDLNAVLSLDALNEARLGATLESGSVDGNAFATSTDAVFDPSVSDVSFVSFVKPFDSYTVSLSLQRVTRFSGQHAFGAFDDSLLDYYQTQQEIGLTLDNFGVSFAFKTSELLSVGFSIRYGRLELDALQESRVDYLEDLELEVLPAGSSLAQVQALGILDQQIRRETFDSSAGDIDFNVGLLFNAGGRWSLGIVYKDGGQYELEGESASFACLAESPEGSLVCEPEGTNPETRSIKVPDFFGLGVAWRASDRLKFALDGNWISFSDLSLFESDDIPPPLREEVEVVDDVLELHLGMEYISFVGSNRNPLTLRAGVFTDPDHDGFAQIDSSRTALTLGIGTVFFESFQLDVAGQ